MEKPQGHTVVYAEGPEWNQQSAKSVVGYVEREAGCLLFLSVPRRRLASFPSALPVTVKEEALALPVEYNPLYTKRSQLWATERFPKGIRSVVVL